VEEQIKAAPDQVSGLSSNISSVNNQIDELTKQKNAVQDGVCTNAKNQMISYINANVLPLYPGGYLVYGSGFGTIAYGSGNISAWSIYENITPPLPAPPVPVPTVVYSYTPGDYPDIDQWVSDYAFGNDYITRPLTSGATYGLTPNIDILGDGKDILQENSDKISDSIDVFSRYAT
jgi:hypothetical protein